MQEGNANTHMLPPRMIRITAATLVILLAAAVGLGYDFHHGVNIVETFFEPASLGCF